METKLDEKALAEEWRQKWIAVSRATLASPPARIPSGYLPSRAEEVQLAAWWVEKLYKSCGFPAPRTYLVPSPQCAHYAAGLAAWALHAQLPCPTSPPPGCEGFALGVWRAAVQAMGGTVPALAEYPKSEWSLEHSYSIGDLDALRAVVAQFGGDEALETVRQYWPLIDGGNQWCGAAQIISFSREVQGKPTENEEWLAYEQLAYFGPRAMHPSFVLVAERPRYLRFDGADRRHSDTGPYVEWADGSCIFSWHGIEVPGRLVVSPETITIEEILNERNAEVRAVMMERFGWERFLVESKAVGENTDDFGTLYSVEMPGLDEPMRFVKVVNATPEPDGTYRDYVLPVDPQLRPLPDALEGETEYGEPQALTARNAVASTFGLRGEHYLPNVET